MDIVTPGSQSQRQAALLKAFQAVGDFKKVEGFYRTKRIPEDEYFINTLTRDIKIPRDRADKFAEVFRANITFLRSFKVDTETPALPDIAHIAGLVVGGVHPSPFPHAHIVTTTTHKTLRGPRGGLIMTNDPELAKAINRSVFPGLQGGPLMHIIAAKAVAFNENLQPAFKAYAQQIVKNARALAEALIKLGYRLTSGGTDNHLMLVDLRPRDAELTGADAEKALEAAGIISNKNGIPNDPRPPKVTSGLRLGTPALTTRGLKEANLVTVAGLIDEALQSRRDADALAKLRQRVADFAAKFPMPH